MRMYKSGTNQLIYLYLDVHFVPRNGFQYFILWSFYIQTEVVHMSSPDGK